MYFRALSLARLVSLLTAFSGANAAWADTLTQTWAIAPEERVYVTTSNLERGLGYNPATRNVLLLSRAEGPTVYVLRAADGSDGSEETGVAHVLSSLDEIGDTPISGGTFPLNLVGAGDDGVVYACNLATSIGTVRIYRWANDSEETPVSVAYSGDPLEGIETPGSGQDIRFGDNFAVRGAGVDTRLVQTARNGKYILVYTTTDGLTFTPKTFPTPSDISGKIGLGVAFGEGDTIWAKLNGVGLQRIALDFATGQATLLDTIPTTIVGAGVAGIGVDPAARVLAAVDYVGHTLSVFDLTDPAGLVQIGEALPFPAANGNANGTAAAAVHGTNIFGLDTNNGLIAAAIQKSVVADPPTIVTQPAGGSVYAGGTLTLAVAAQGTPPFTYQWYLGDAPIADANGAQLTLASVTAAQEGDYTVEVANAAGTLRSAVATLAVRLPVSNGILKPLWALNPGDRPYLATDNSQRGLAWNPASGNVLVASRSPNNTIAVLDPATGAEKHRLRTTGEDELPVFFGGTLVLNRIGVSEDGVVFAANLVTDGSAASFRLYRWDHDGPDAVPVVLGDVPELAIVERWGDTFDVRGSGAAIEILLGARGLAPQEGGKFAVLTSADGYQFNAMVYAVEGLPAASVFGLGLAFGEGNTVFGTANGQPLVRATFDPATGTAALARTYPAELVPMTVSFLGVNPATKQLAGVALETPDNVVLYDLTDVDSPALIEQQLIVPEQPNVNGTGSVAFGGNRLFALDTNHGLRAYDIVPGGASAPASFSGMRVSAGVFSFTLTGTAGRAYQVQRSADLKTWTDAGIYTAPATGTDAGAGAGAAFYRAIAR